MLRKCLASDRGIKIVSGGEFMLVSKELFLQPVAGLNTALVFYKFFEESRLTFHPMPKQNRSHDKVVTDTSQVNRISTPARDLIGYGREPPPWEGPKGWRQAISFGVNY